MQSSRCLYLHVGSSRYSPRMSAWSLLLRVLICMTLALNGVATAAMSVHMPGAMTSATSAKQIASPQQQATKEMPCHGHHAAGATSALDSTTAVDPKPAADGHGKSGCCKSGLCQCACMQGVQAAMTATLPATVMFGRVVSTRTLPLGHAAPALLHLIRPPIG